MKLCVAVLLASIVVTMALPMHKKEVKKSVSKAIPHHPIKLNHGAKLMDLEETIHAKPKQHPTAVKPHIAHKEEHVETHKPAAHKPQQKVETEYAHPTAKAVKVAKASGPLIHGVAHKQAKVQPQFEEDYRDEEPIQAEPQFEEYEAPQEPENNEFEEEADADVLDKGFEEDEIVHEVAEVSEAEDLPNSFEENESDQDNALEEDANDEASYDAASYDNADELEEDENNLQEPEAEEDNEFDDAIQAEGDNANEEDEANAEKDADADAEADVDAEADADADADAGNVGQFEESDQAEGAEDEKSFLTRASEAIFGPSENNFEEDDDASE